MTIRVDLRLNRGGFQLAADFEVPASGFTALFGPSGCGKTTLLRAIAGLEPAADGTLRVGPDTWQDDNRRLPPHRRPVGYVFQQPVLFAHLGVRENLCFGARRHLREKT